MVLTDLTADAIDGNEPQRVNNCLIWFNLTAIPGWSASTNDPILAMAQDAFPLPKREIGVIQLARLNEKRNFAGNPVYQPMTVVYKDFVNVSVAELLYTWYKVVHDATTGQTGFKSNYACLAYVYLYPPDGTASSGGTAYVRCYEAQGCWPSAFDQGEASMDGEEAVKINMTVQMDKIYDGNSSGSNPTATYPPPGSPSGY